MTPFFEVIRLACENVLKACAVLELPPGSIKLVFWSDRLNGEVTNSGCPETDLMTLSRIHFNGM